MEKTFFPSGIKNIEFTYRPDPVPYNYRISYKVAQLCLILHFILKRGGCSFIRLQMISVALTSNYDMVQLKDYLNGNLPDYSIIKFDPAVNIALQYAMAENLINMQKDGKYKLSVNGKKFSEMIVKDNSIMKNEKELLSFLSGRISEEDVSKLINKWGQFLC